MTAAAARAVREDDGSLGVGWGTILVFWVLLLGFTVARGAVWMAVGVSDTSPTAWQVARLSGVNLLLWLAATPLLLWLVRRFPFAPGRRLAAAAAHLAALVAVSGAMAGVRWLEVFYGIGTYIDPVRFLASNFDREAFVFTVAVAAGHAARSMRELRLREVREAGLERALAEARVEGMRRRVDPAFVFAVLADARAMVRRDPDGADELISTLGDFLRAKALGGASPRVSLDEELTLARAYLEVQAARAGRPLALTLRVSEDARIVPVAPFSTQPLFERALAAPGADPSHLVFSAMSDGGALRLEARAGEAAEPARLTVPLSAGFASAGADASSRLALASSPGR